MRMIVLHQHWILNDTFLFCKLSFLTLAWQGQPLDVGCRNLVHGCVALDFNWRISICIGIVDERRNKPWTVPEAQSNLKVVYRGRHEPTRMREVRLTYVHPLQDVKPRRGMKDADSYHKVLVIT